MGFNSFNELLVWQKAHSLVLEIYQATRNFPKEEQFGLVAQIRRSAVSVAANIVEGSVKSTKDFVRFLDIARGSIEETKYHLILAKDLNFLDLGYYDRLNSSASEISKMICGLSKKLRF